MPDSGKSTLQPLKTLVIVGGGTAGWIAAALIKASFGSSLSVTVVESDRVATVGVGEASLPALRSLLRALRIDEVSLFRECDASLKAGIQFVGWRNAQPNDVYYHPFFGTDESGALLKLIYTLQARPGTEESLWHNLAALGLLDSRDFMTSWTLAGQLIEAKRASRRSCDAAYTSPLGYGYHVNAKLFAEFLSGWCLQRGVRHIRDHVVSVQVEENGDIGSLLTEKHGVIAADFFVDCSGFRGLLINETLGEPFDAYRPWLLCDSAVAIQVPYERSDGPLPSCTRVKALTAGWAWKLPLFSRQGTGYVYSRELVSRDQAEAELRARLGPGSLPCTANHLQMRVGKHRRTWVNNCLSVGLAAGFLEALESTSIALIQRGVAKFLTCFRGGRFEEHDRDRYNRLMTEVFEECRDFIVLHYCLNQRVDTPFWHEARRTQIPARIEALLEEWRTRGNAHTFFKAHGTDPLFPPISWYSILFGMTGEPQGRQGERSRSGLHSTSQWLSRWKAHLRQEASGFPDHRAYLAGLRDETTSPANA
jgi:tryptophan halogenase